MVVGHSDGTLELFNIENGEKYFTSQPNQASITSFCWTQWTDGYNFNPDLQTFWDPVSYFYQKTKRDILLFHLIKDFVLKRKGITLTKLLIFSHNWKEFRF